MSETGKLIKIKDEDDIDDVFTEKMSSTETYGRIADYASKAFDITRDGESDGNNLWNAEINAIIDSTSLKSLFFSEDWVYIIVDLAASKLSAQRLQVMKEEINEDGQTIISPDDAHPFNKILDMPNNWQDYHSWMYLQAVEFFLMGNNILWWDKRNQNIMVVPSNTVTLNFDQDCALTSYMIIEGDCDNPAARGVFSIPPEQVIHIRRPNPQSLLWGLSPFVAGRKSVLFNRYSSDYLNAFYLKQATPGLALTMDKEVNEKIALRMLRSFEMANGGRRNQRRTAILPKGVDIKPLSHTVADQRLVELVGMNRETIINLLKVPKHELGLQTAGSLGSEEYKMALRNFWEATLIPAMRMIEGAITRYFQGMLGEGRFLQFNLDDVEILQDDKLKRAEIAQKMLDSGWTLNEVRTEIWEKPADTSDDRSDKPFPLVKINPAQPALGFSAQAPQLTEAQSVDQEEEQFDEEAYALEYLSANKEAVDMSIKQVDNQTTNRQLSMMELVLGVFVDLAVEAIDIIGRSLKDEKSLVTKAEIPSKKILRRRIERAFDNFEERYVDGYTTTLESTVELGYDTQLRFVFNAPDATTIQSLRARDEEKRRLLLQARGIESFSQISKTHTERIMAEITRGVDANETIDQIQRRIADTFSDPEAMSSKARTIARTEVLTAVSIGQNAAAQNAKEVIPNLKKIWVTAGDERVRPSHERLDGQVRNIDAAFSNGLRYPRDTDSGKPEELINCRCTLITVPEDEIGNLQGLPERG